MMPRKITGGYGAPTKTSTKGSKKSGKGKGGKK
jgi:hypothetical protein